MTTTAPFVFDKDYDNLDQVAHLWDAYDARYQEIRDAGYAIAYNDMFVGKIDGLVADEKNEATAIYLLQRTRHQRAWQKEVESLREQGYTEPTGTELDDRAHRFEAVAIVDKRYRAYGEVHVIPSARLITDGSTVLAVLPKYARSRCHSIAHNETAYVLVKRA